MKLNVNGLNVHKVNSNQALLTNIHFELESGQILGVIGPSGSGKTTFLHALIGIMSSSLQVSGQVTYTFSDGQQKEQIFNTKETLKNVLSIGYIPQDAMNIFDPIEKMDQQMIETFCENGWTLAEATEKAQRIITDFQLPEKILTQYPHELSGGTLQRCVVGIALELEPDLVLADEPTSALDSETKKIILNKLYAYTKKQAGILLFTSHDISVINQLSEYLLVLEKGQQTYFGPINQIEATEILTFYTQINEIDQSMTNLVKELWNDAKN